PMLKRSQTLAAVAALLIPVVVWLVPAAAAQTDSFSQRFTSVLTQHGVIGGGIAIVHPPDASTHVWFGEARRETGQRTDADTAYNWASITKTMTAIAILQL